MGEHQEEGEGELAKVDGPRVVAGCLRCGLVLLLREEAILRHLPPLAYRQEGGGWVVAAVMG